MNGWKDEEEVAAMGLLGVRQAISPRRKRAALMVAIVADVVLWCTAPLSLWGIFSPVEDARDIVVAIVLLCVVGWRWQLAAAFLVELVPGLDLCPTWTAFVLLLPTERVGELGGGGIRVRTVAVVPPVLVKGSDSSGAKES